MRRAPLLLLLAVAAAPATAAQQAAMERITFDEAVQRAVTRNPTIEQASAGILRAEALLQQVGALSLPTLDATLSTRTIGPVQQFAGESINPRTQLTTSAVLGVPLLTPVRWALRAQARDQVVVSRRSADDIRREIGVAAAQAYLAIITQRRVVELNERARENANAHFDFAQRRYEGGLGSRLNALRAQQELSTDEARVEDARLALRRAQEALGVLVAADGPVDAAAEPAFDIPGNVAQPGAATTPAPAGAPAAPIADRTDVQLSQARIVAAERVVRDSWKDYLPELTGVFSPQILTPSGLFAPTRSWSASLIFSVPVFELGERRGLARERQALLDVVRAERAGVERQALSEVRAALEAVRSTEHAFERSRAAAEQANEVVQITDVAFRAGATTNIEVIDAQRGARDAETAAAIAEDALRRAKLDLLVALGRFPR
jgi:outer membrane protein TolC